MREYDFQTDGQTFRVDTPWGRDTGVRIQQKDGRSDFVSLMTVLDEGQYYDLHSAAVKAVLKRRVGRKNTGAKRAAKR